tara:strand:- start:122 stop:367 length:246 start_codon:yes stop_codon:yes gene_type:complete
VSYSIEDDIQATFDEATSDAIAEVCETLQAEWDEGCFINSERAHEVAVSAFYDREILVEHTTRVEDFINDSILGHVSIAVN